MPKYGKIRSSVQGPKHKAQEPTCINHPATGELIANPEDIKRVPVPETYNYTKLFGLWKGKVSELDLNMMRYIHGKDWDAKMLEALV